MADETLPTLNELLSADLSRVRHALHAAGIRRGTPAEGVRELAAGRDHFREEAEHARKLYRELYHAASERIGKLEARVREQADELLAWQGCAGFNASSCEFARLELAKVQAERDALAASLTASHEALARANRACGELMEQAHEQGEEARTERDEMGLRWGRTVVCLQAERDEALRERNKTRSDLAKHRSRPDAQELAEARALLAACEDQRDY